MCGRFKLWPTALGLLLQKVKAAFESIFGIDRGEEGHASRSQGSVLFSGSGCARYSRQREQIFRKGEQRTQVEALLSVRPAGDSHCSKDGVSFLSFCKTPAIR